LEHNVFSNQKQIELLHVVNYALHKKHYPQDTCGIVEKKIKLLELTDRQTTEQDNADTCAERSRSTACIKVRSVVILELLRKMQLGTAHNDLTKICKLITFLTGNSYNSIYNEMQKGVYFSHYHAKQIDEANKILSELNASISIDKNKQY
jgi:hypothetical protein